MRCYYDNIIYLSNYTMLALINYTPRFRTCASQLSFAFLTLPFLLYCIRFSLSPFLFLFPSLTLFLFPFNKLLARLSGCIVFPLWILLYLFHILRVSKEDTLARTKISLGTYDERKKKRKRHILSKSDETKEKCGNTKSRRKSAKSNNSDERDKEAKIAADAGKWAVTALQHADFAKKIAVFVGDSYWNVSHLPRPFYAIPRFCEGDASRRNLRSKSAIRSPDVPDENLIANIKCTHIPVHFSFFFWKKIYTLLCFWIFMRIDNCIEYFT